MSYLYRWVRHNQSLTARSSALLASGKIMETSPASSIRLTNIKPLYRIVQAQTMTTTPTLMAPAQGPKKEDDIKYVIKFKQLDVKGIFKQFYSLYGPLFVACYLGVGLTSLGFFCSLTYFAIDLNQFIPHLFYQAIGDRMAEMTGTGGKFVLAYAVHKAILPLRLGGSIYLTRFLSRKLAKNRAPTNNK